MSGFKKFGYDCKNGMNCFNEKHRLDFEEFYGSLPGKISMTDIDATVEVGGFFLFMEVKQNGEFPIGQQLYFAKLTATSDKIMSLILYGEANPLNFHTLQRVWGGRIHRPEETSKDGVLAIINNWAKSPKDAMADWANAVKLAIKKVA